MKGKTTLAGLAAGACLLGGVVSLATADTRNYFLQGPGGPGETTHWISVPDILTDPDVSDCGDLLAHIPNATRLSRYDRNAGEFIDCACPVECFAVVPGQGYQVRVDADSSFAIAGFNQNDLVVDLTGTGSARTLVSIPFDTAAIDSNALVADINADAGAAAVVSVARYDTALDGIVTYVPPNNFALVEGEGYQIQVNQEVSWTPDKAAGGNTCGSPFNCVFDGLVNRALGDAQLAINASDHLVVSEIGPDGNDGVEIENNNSPQFKTGHTEWIDLGLIGTEPESLATTTTGSFVRVTSFAVLTDAGSGSISVQITSNVEKTGGGTLDISTDFTPTLASGLSFEVLDDGSRVDLSTGNGLFDAAEADAWPSVMAFSLFRWNMDVAITTPGGVFLGDELRIIPESPTRDVIGVSRLNVLAKNATLAAELLDLSDLVITQESIAAPLPPSSTPSAVPGYPAWALVPLALILMAGMAYLLARGRF